MRQNSNDNICHISCAVYFRNPEKSDITMVFRKGASGVSYRSLSFDDAMDTFFGYLNMSCPEGKTVAFKGFVEGEEKPVSAFDPDPHVVFNEFRDKLYAIINTQLASA